MECGADPVERIKDHIRDGIDAEIIFPNKGLMMFATRDAGFGMAQCKVWNDFAWEMYGKYNDFMSPAAAIMTSDVALAIEEIRRVAKMGFRFLTLPCKPMFGGHDSRDSNYNLLDFDPMWAAIQDVDLPITFHVSTGRDPRAARKEGGAVINYVAHSLVTEHRAGRQYLRFGCPGAISKNQICRRRERDRMGTVGPRCDGRGLRQASSVGISETEKTSERIFPQQRRRDLPGGSAGPELAEAYNLVDNFMWANDYPHAEGTWPHSAEAIEREMGALKEESRAKS